jgi:uncharacterized protein (DUF427 family)
MGRRSLRGLDVGEAASGHAADRYDRIDIRRTFRRLVVRSGDTIIAETSRRLASNSTETFCPYKGICSYYDIGGAGRAAWSYRDAYTEVGRVSDHISFEPDKVIVELDDRQLHLEPGQSVVSHGIDRDLSVSGVRAVV